jgi:hypothetical protein
MITNRLKTITMDAVDHSENDLEISIQQTTDSYEKRGISPFCKQARRPFLRISTLSPFYRGKVRQHPPLSDGEIRSPMLATEV